MNILFIDLHAIFHPYWHAGVNKPAGFAFRESLGRIRALVREYDHTAVMSDGAHSFRAELDSRWKKNRDEKNAGLFAELQQTERQLEAEGVWVFKVDGFEADDLTASGLAQLRTLLNPGGMLEGVDLHVTINSSDRDLYGLLEPGVRMLTATSPHRLVHAEDLRQSKKIGVDPSKIRDFLVISDSHNGVNYFPGVGPAHASRLLNQFGDIHGIIRALDNRVPDTEDYEVHPPSIRAAIKKALSETVDGRPLLDVAMQVVTLRTDAPIDIRKIFEKKAPKPAPQEDWNGEDAPSDEDRRILGSNGEGAAGVGMASVGQESVGLHQGARTGGSDLPPSEAKGTVSDGANAHADSMGHGVLANGCGATFHEDESVAVVAQPLGGNQVPSKGASRATSTATIEALVPPSHQSVGVVAPRWELALEPVAIQDAWRLAHRATESGFWQKHGGPSGCMMLIMAGRSRGLTAFDALNGMHIIEGKPCFGAWLLIGMVQRDKRCEYFELAESDERHALWITKKKGSKREQKRLYTIDNAVTAKLVRPNSNWEKHPEDMLIKTAGAKLTRAAWADITSGAVAAEEMGYE